MRLKTELWIKAYLRRCALAGHAVYVARRGDGDAGAVFVEIDLLNGRHLLLGPAIGMAVAADGERLWRYVCGPEPVDTGAISEAIGREIQFDPDIWHIIVEQRDGLALIENNIVQDGEG